jgi:hypothetical protein
MAPKEPAWAALQIVRHVQTQHIVILVLQDIILIQQLRDVLVEAYFRTNNVYLVLSPSTGLDKNVVIVLQLHLNAQAAQF